MRALIVEEGSQTGALAAVRALTRAGWSVGIGSPRPGGLAASSRWTRRWHLVPPPERDLESFLDAVAKAVRVGEYEVVFGAGDAEVLALSLGRDRLGCAVPYGPHAVVLAAFDKLGLVEAARRVGLATPATEPADGGALERLGSPVLVKPRLQWTPGATNAPSKIAVVLPRDREQAARRVAEIRAAGGEPLFQEVVEGRLVAHATVVDPEGRALAGVQQETEAIWPSRIGGSVRAATVAVGQELATRVGSLLADLGWVGLAQVQFMVPADGQPRLIDLNGRFYGSLALAVSAGVNLPDIWARLATGREVGKAAPPAVGIRYQWLEGDLRRAWVERRGGLIRDLSGCVAYARGATDSVWSRDDPAPALRHGVRLAARAAGKLGRLTTRRPA